MMSSSNVQYSCCSLIDGVATFFSSHLGQLEFSGPVLYGNVQLAILGCLSVTENTCSSDYYVAHS